MHFQGFTIISKAGRNVWKNLGVGDKIMFRETVPSGQNMFVMFILYENMRGLHFQNMDIRQQCHL